ncbi:DUF6730 family protein [Maribacter arenosus]|uniref:Uncharacterized protein n=1 Tax=Maribacter arenosus TaxID=1854708 RepID=A0ABR7VG17_9FLAO|nr:DUF6730 family protein [Maribacter arenosus]MBD0852579.1 hypothetical protein [Maribacter arenosus]
MGYKKLDEIMELLSDELDGFNKSLEKLEGLTKNMDNIEIKPDTSQIDYLLKEHLDTEKAKSSRLQESILIIGKQISRARLVPKTQLWVHYSIWSISLVIIGYLAFRVSRIDHIQQKAFLEGRQQVISDLKGYFERYPGHYESYQKWIKEKNSAPNQE